MQNIAKISLVIFALLLNSCCFHLRSEAAYPCPLRVIYIKSNDPYGEFETKLKKAFATTKICVVKCPQDALYALEILHTNTSSLPSSVGTSSQATVYKVTFSAEIQLIDCRGKVIVSPQTVTSSSIMIVNAQQALSSTNQIDVLTAQLQRETIIKIFAILTSEQVCRAVNDHHENHIRTTR